MMLQASSFSKALTACNFFKTSIQSFYIMKKFLFTGLLFAVLLFNACKDHDDMAHDSEYHIHFMEPANNASLTSGDVLHVHVEFEEHHGGTIHHVNLRAFHKSTGNELFSVPAEAHIHGASPYTFEYEYTLNGIAPGTYILEAKVWGHEAGEEEVSSTREFTVN